jgi:hypothetical protein
MYSAMRSLPVQLFEWRGSAKIVLTEKTQGFRLCRVNGRLGLEREICRIRRLNEIHHTAHYFLPESSRRTYSAWASKECDVGA